MVRQKPKIEITNLTPCPIKCNKKALNNQGFFIICRLVFFGAIEPKLGIEGDLGSFENLIKLKAMLKNC
jgi:hypothetical protein